jgi:hypothetical protein
MIGISVIKNHKELPLKLGNLSRTTIEEFEAIFDLERAFKGGFSMNVKIPVEGNETILDHSHSIAVRDGANLFNIIIYDRGVATYRATLLIDKSNYYRNNEFYDTDIVFTSFSVLSKGKMLKDVLTKEINFANSVDDVFADISDYFLTQFWPDAPCAFPEIRLVDSEGVDVVGNRYDVTNEVLVDAGSGNNNFSNPTIPQPFYAEVLRETFREFGYNVQGPIFENERFTRLLMPNYKPLYDYRRHNEIELKTTEDRLITTRTNIIWDEVVWNSTAYTVTSPGTIFYVSQPGVGCQQITVRLKVKSISSGGKVRIYRREYDTWTSGYQLLSWVDFWAVDGDVIEHTFKTAQFSASLMTQIEIDCVDDVYDDFLELASDNYVNEDDVEFILGEGSSITVVNMPNTATLPEYRRYMRTSMRLGEMVPPTYTVDEFLLAVKKSFGLKIDIDEFTSTVHISSFEDMRKYPVEELDHTLDGYEKEEGDSFRYKIRWGNDIESIENLALLGSVPDRRFMPDNSIPNTVVDGNGIFVISENAYYHWKDDKWQYHSLKVNELEFGEGENVIDFVLPMKLIEMRSDVNWGMSPIGVLPCLKYEYAGSYYGVGDEEWELMVMLWMGIYENGDEIFKPWATSTAYEWDGKLIEAFSLQISDREGKYFDYFQKGLLTMLTKPTIVTVRVMKNYSTLRNQILRKKIYFRGNHFLEKARVGQIGADETTTKLELYRL